MLNEIERLAGPDVNKMILGNKCDMVQTKKVTFEEAQVGEC